MRGRSGNAISTWGPLSCLLLLGAQASAVTITFNYSYDGTGFFTGNPTAKATLEAVGQMFSQRLEDTLSAIAPSGGNSWDLVFTRPDTGVSGQWVHNPSIAADQLVVYVGSRDLGGATLAQGGPGGWNASGFQSWFELLRTRGESNTTGAGATDFGPWGGALSFDDDAGGYGWHWDQSTPVAAGKVDLFTVATHELAHVLGIGTADSWDTWVAGSSGSYVFTGPVSVASYGGNVPLDAGQAHWQTGVTSVAKGHSQIAVMTPVITAGLREHFTNLDWAGLDDVGWEVAPSTEVIRGDVNLDGVINALDISPFVGRLTSGSYQAESDVNVDGLVNALDIAPFIAALTGGGAGAAVPEVSGGLVLAVGLAGLGRRRAGAEFRKF